MIENLEVRKIRPPRHTLRSSLGPLEGLMTSIAEKGLLQPIVVRPIADGFETVAGHRRLEACRKLGIRKIPCHIVELDDREAYEASLIENVQHRTLSPLEEAKGFHNYVEEYGYGGASDLAEKIGKSPSYVSRRIALLSSGSEPINELLRQRKIPVTVAQELLSLDEGTRSELVEYITVEKVTRSQIRRIVKERAKEEDGSGHFSQYDLERAHLRSFNRALDRCIISLKVCMSRLDDILEYLDDSNWLAKETIIQYRTSLHQQIDGMMRQKKRTSRAPPVLWGGGA